MTKDRQFEGSMVWCLRSHGLLSLLLLHHKYFPEHIVLLMFSFHCKTCKIGCVNNLVQLPWMELFLFSILLKFYFFLSSFLCGTCTILWLLLKVKLSSFFSHSLPRLLKSVFQQVSLEDSLTWLSVAFCIKSNEMFPMLRELWSFLRLKICLK